MVQRRRFDDEQWARIAPRVAALTRRGPKGDQRSFVEAVAWILRTGAPWRDLLKEFGYWERCYRRFRRWVLAGKWEALRRAVDPHCNDDSVLLIDSTIVKAHPDAAGALRRNGGQAVEALGRSRGGFTTKLHALVTGRGRLLRYSLTGGEVHDITQAAALVNGGGSAPSPWTVVIGDRAYDSDAFVECVESLGMRTVIPSRATRLRPRDLDETSYARRNVIERFFGRLKRYRRVATRYEKTASSCLGFVAFAAWMITGWAG
jgi:transposase